MEIRPYDIEGRNDYYAETQYFEKANRIFQTIDSLHNKHRLSRQSSSEWENFLQSAKMFDLAGNHTLEEINSPLFMSYSHIKNLITYETLISITEREIPSLSKDARMIYDFWKCRNQAMAANIEKYCKEFKDKTILVLCGHSHKYYLQELLKNHLNFPKNE